MSLEIVRKIRGNLHGSVDVSAIEDEVIAHPWMQRLRRIKQTAFLSLVFPSATHTRFEHSLGVLHLAAIAWERIWRNQKRLLDSVKKFPDYAQREKKGGGELCHGLIAPTEIFMSSVASDAYIMQTVRLAALMHDLGHPAFSHSGERFLPSLEVVVKENADLPGYLLDYFRTVIEQEKNRGRTAKASHEIYTLIFIHKILEEINTERPDLDLIIDPRDVIAVINPRISLAEKSPLAKHKLQQFCHEIVSGEIDVDRMDYLLRDSQECGVIYGVFDVQRILDSLIVYVDPVSEELHLGLQYSGLAAFEDYLRARHSMYLQLYFHKTSVAAEVMLKNLTTMLGGWTLPAKAEAYAGVDEYNIYGLLQEEAKRTLPDPREQKDFIEILDNLLLNRRLWKRVYEINTSLLSESEKSILEKVGDIIQALGLRFDALSSATTLTRFRPRSEDEYSKNYLRVVKKDKVQILRVMPIEDFSDIINKNATRQIHRVYVEDVKPGQGKVSPWDVINAIRSTLDDSKNF